MLEEIVREPVEGRRAGEIVHYDETKCRHHAQKPQRPLQETEGDERQKKDRHDEEAELSPAAPEEMQFAAEAAVQRNKRQNAGKHESRPGQRVGAVHQKGQREKREPVQRHIEHRPGAEDRLQPPSFVQDSRLRVHVGAVEIEGRPEEQESAEDGRGQA